MQKNSTNSISIKIIQLRHKTMIQQIQHWYCYNNDTIVINNQYSFSWHRYYCENFKVCSDLVLCIGSNLGLKFGRDVTWAQTDFAR